MKNVFRLALASIVLMMSCSKDNELPTPVKESTKFYASIEDPTTRTSVSEYGKLSWSNDDEITLFSNTYAQQCRYTGESDGKSVFVSVSSQVSSATELTANYAIYPYAANTTISNDGKILYTIPSTQKYAVNSFGLGANPMVAVTKNTEDNFLAFKNLCGYFEFSLYGNVAVKSIEFRGNNGEKLAGAATITATNQDAPTFVFADDATETLTLDCGDGVQLGADAENATRFWFVVPAITYSKGITITITDTDGKVMEKLTTNSITIERSTVQPLNAFDVETHDVNTPPNNQIWYTSRDCEIVIPYLTYVFGASIVSNVYENGKGIITFDGDITSVGKQAFYYCESLTSITIPDGVTSIGNNAFFCCSRLTSVTIPDSVTLIEKEAFSACSSLVSVTIPNSVTSIGENAFYSCINLSGFYGKFASADNRCLIIDGVLHSFAPAGLTEYTIPNSITKIGSDAFSGYSDLTSVIIPDYVTSIGDWAFSPCGSLTNVYCKPTIPPSLGAQSFKINASNRKIYVPTASVEAYKNATDWNIYADDIVGYDFE